MDDKTFYERRGWVKRKVDFSEYEEMARRAEKEECSDKIVQAILKRGREICSGV